jgi:hypothetical protein
MIIKIDASREFYPALLDEFKNNPQAIPDMAKEVAKNATAIATEIFEEAIGSCEKYLRESNITLKVAVELGNTKDFTDNLAERMTEEERNKIRILYNNLKEGLSLCHEDCVYDALESLEEIFSKDLFNAD